MKNLLNRKLFELFELFDKKVRNYSLFNNFLNPYLNPSPLHTAASRIKICAKIDSIRVIWGTFCVCLSGVEQPCTIHGPAPVIPCI
jgi:hypothetical protein